MPKENFFEKAPEAQTDNAPREERNMLDGLMQKIGQNKKVRSLVSALAFFTAMAVAGCGEKKETPAEGKKIEYKHGTKEKIDKSWEEYEKWNENKKSNWNIISDGVNKIGFDTQRKIEESIARKENLAYDLHEKVATDKIDMNLKLAVIANEKGFDLKKVLEKPGKISMQYRNNDMACKFGGGEELKGSIGREERIKSIEEFITLMAIKSDINKDKELSAEEKSANLLNGLSAKAIMEVSSMWGVEIPDWIKEKANEYTQKKKSLVEKYGHKVDASIQQGTQGIERDISEIKSEEKTGKTDNKSQENTFQSKPPVIQGPTSNPRDF